MNIRNISITVMLIFVITINCGCIEERNNNLDNKENNSTIHNLTHEDWGYFVYHHTSGKELRDIFTSGFSIINSELSYYSPLNSTFLLELTQTNQDKLYSLRNISDSMNLLISTYSSILQNFTLSNTMEQHGILHQSLLDNYHNISYAFISIYTAININVNLTNNTTKLIDISDEMLFILIADERNSEILDKQIQIIVNIPDEKWDEWTRDRDWSFME